MSLTVYVLFHETNTGHTEESDGYIEAIYQREADAEAARLKAIRAARDEGHAIYWDPDTEEDFPDTWEHDWRVEVHTLYDAADLPTAGFFDFLTRPRPCDLDHAALQAELIQKGIPGRCPDCDVPLHPPVAGAVEAPKP